MGGTGRVSYRMKGILYDLSCNNSSLEKLEIESILSTDTKFNDF